MMRRRWASGVAALAAFGLSFSPGAGAQVARLVDSSEVTARDSHVDLAVQFGCAMRYVAHDPVSEGDTIRIRLRPGSDCGLGFGAQFPTQTLLPTDSIGVVRRIEMSPTVSGEAELAISWNRVEKFVLAPTGDQRGLRVRLLRPERAGAAVIVDDSRLTSGTYAINLDSSREPFAPDVVAKTQRSLKVPTYTSETVVEGVTWYRLRLGPFPNAKQAEKALLRAQKVFPRAWLAIDDETAAGDAADGQLPSPAAAGVAPASAMRADPKLDKDLAKAKKLLGSKKYPECVELLTRILGDADYARRAEAQEMLGLARERNKQLAHAKAEYEEYLRRYPGGAGADRVRKRLSALRSAGLAGRRRSGDGAANQVGGWTFIGNASQFYRWDDNKLETDTSTQNFTSQNSLINDFDFTLRRKGERYDFTSRVSAGYIKDLLPAGNADQARVSSAFAEFRDRERDWSVRAGRQSRNTGGILGSFDGVAASWQMRPRLGLNLVTGLPVETSKAKLDTHRRFVGLSLDVGTFSEAWETTFYVLGQEFYGQTDRQSVGAEARYFRPGRTLVTLVDYDVHFAELNNAIVIGTLVLPSRWTLNVDASRISSPTLSTRNALIGQPVLTFDELLGLFTLDELEQLARDRTGASTTLSLTASRPLGDRMHWTSTLSSIDGEGTPASGGVDAIAPIGRENSITTELLVNGWLKAGDVNSLALRYQTGGVADTISIGVANRLPIGGAWRLMSRLRVDRREIANDGSTEWLYIPSLRLDYQRARGYFEFEAGTEIGRRDLTSTTLSDQKTTRYYFSLGYRFLFDRVPR